MPKILNVPDFVKIGVFAMVFIYAADKTLRKVGLDKFVI